MTTSPPGCCYGDSYTGNDVAPDYEMTTTTEYETPGCCSSDIARKFEMCNAKKTQALCERSNDCDFVVGEDAV